MSLKGFAAAVVLSILPLLSFSQVKVSGGETKDIKQFVSPMVLELPLKAFFETPMKKEWLTNELNMFSCKGIIIDALSMTQRQGKNGKPLAIIGTVEVTNTSEDDARTTIYFELVLGGEVIGLDTVEAEIEEGGKEDARFFSGRPPGPKRVAKATWYSG